MSGKRDEILDALKGGPILFRKLMHGRSAAFQIAYRRLLLDGAVDESGMGTHHDPKYVGLKGAAFPLPRLTVRRADVDLLVRSGMVEEEARKVLADANAVGKQAVWAVCEAARDRILERGEGGLTFKYQVEEAPL